MKFMMFSLLTLFSSTTAFSATDADASTHDFTVKNIEGKDVELSDYKGKVLVIVNTASKCGFTKQYANLVTLQKEYEGKEVVILGFPANNFGRQEPGSNEEIQTFCERNFGVDFPMFSKVSVKGDDQVPLFDYLTTAENPDFTGAIRWNFEKFIVGPDGKVARRFRSQTKPDSDEVKAAIDQLLPKQP